MYRQFNQIIQKKSNIRARVSNWEDCKRMDNSTLGIWEAAAAKKRWKGGADNSWLPPLWGNLCRSCQILLQPCSAIEDFKNCQ